MLTGGNKPVGDAIYVLHYVTTVTSYGHMTIRLSIDHFLCVLNRNQMRILLSFHNVITDVIRQYLDQLSVWIL